MAFNTKTESELLERTFISSLFNARFRPSFCLSRAGCIRPVSV